MYNWSVDEKKLKNDKKKFAIWKIEQMVNFGLFGKKLKEKDVKKYFNKISIDPARRKFLELLIDFQKNEKDFNKKANHSSKKNRAG